MILINYDANCMGFYGRASMGGLLWASMGWLLWAGFYGVATVCQQFSTASRHTTQNLNYSTVVACHPT